MPLLQLRGISKAFPGVRALDAVDLTVHRGEVHALMGENGAGKSTLIKVLTGVYRRDSGEIELEGRAINPASPAEAQAQGISTVYQEINLIPHLSVAENITLGRQPSRIGHLHWKLINARAKRAIARVGLEAEVSAPLSSYSIAVQQLVAIARALDVEAKVLILDEPTSSLDAREVAQLFSVMRRLKEEGLGIIFVTHFLDQVYQISDRITILRNGKNVAESPAGSLPKLELIARMMGKTIAELEKQLGPIQKGDVGDRRKGFLEVRGFGRKGSIAPFDLDIGEGDVVGLAGLLGSGRTEMAKLLFGIDRAQTGHLSLEGKPRRLASPRDAIAFGFGFCPEDRKLEGIIPNLSIRENIVLALQASRGWWRPLSRKTQRETANHYIKALNIATPDTEKAVKLLSGGNQQKALLARWLVSRPRFLILDEPTRGIDVGAKIEIEKLIRSLAGEGMAILFISSELEEVVRVSGRVVVLSEGAKIAEVRGEDVAFILRLIATSSASAQKPSRPDSTLGPDSTVC